MCTFERLYAAAARDKLCLAGLAIHGVYMERTSWLAKHPISALPLRRTRLCDDSQTHTQHLKRLPYVSDWFSAALRPTCLATTTSRRNSAATQIPSPSGDDAFKANAWMAWMTFLVAADRSLFPPEDRHKVIVLATTKPADLGVPVSHWSLDDLAYHILRDAHYRDMARSTIQRILTDADLKPHRSRYWLHSNDPAFEAKAL